MKSLWPTRSNSSNSATGGRIISSSNSSRVKGKGLNVRKAVPNSSVRNMHREPVTSATMRPFWLLKLRSASKCVLQVPSTITITATIVRRIIAKALAQLPFPSSKFLHKIFWSKAAWRNSISKSIRFPMKSNLRESLCLQKCMALTSPWRKPK